jgi:hypothetical protein
VKKNIPQVRHPDAKLSATSAADAASTAEDIVSANTSNTNNTNKTNSTNNGIAKSLTRVANHLKGCKSTPDGAIACGQKPHKNRRHVFELADIVEVDPTLFTTTVMSGGILLGMSLTERSRSRLHGSSSDKICAYSVLYE